MELALTASLLNVAAKLYVCLQVLDRAGAVTVKFIQVKVVYVRNLPDTVSEEQLQKLFERHGEVTKVVLPSTKPGQAKRDFGFVHFADRAQALKAIEKTEVYELEGEVILLDVPCQSEKFSALSRSASVALSVMLESTMMPVMVYLSVLERPVLRCSMSASTSGSGSMSMFWFLLQAASLRPLWLNLRLIRGLWDWNLHILRSGLVSFPSTKIGVAMPMEVTCTTMQVAPMVKPGAIIRCVHLE